MKDFRANASNTDKQVQDLAADYTPYAAEEAWAEEVAQSEPAPPSAEDVSPAVGSDPTVIHAGLTEIDDQAELATDGVSSHVQTPTVPEASNIDAGAANAAAETHWEAKLSASAESGPDGWIEVARDPAETDTGLDATPAGMTSTQSWAEDVPSEPTPAAAAPPVAQPTTNGGDGFHEVHHGRGRGRNGSQGDYRGGNRGRGGYRGDRGGDGGYRGRGGPRGDRGDRGADGNYRGGGGGRGGRGGYRGSRGRGEGGQ